MKTPYVPHLFGEAARLKLISQQGWLTAGVVSSIAWPREDVWVLYDGHEYVLRGAKGGDHKHPPCISTPSKRSELDAATTRIYQFASILGWFKGGYVDVTGSLWGSGAIVYGSRDTFTTTLDGSKFFSCNYMPVIEDDQTRKALAFLREGRRLRHIHEPYSFLSFFKVVESQFTSNDRVAWITANLDLLDGDAAKRVADLRKQGIDVSAHLYRSGRCAVAHASLSGTAVDPDIPADRRRISEDLDVIAGLANRYVKVDAGVPDEMDLYQKRDRTVPWHSLLPSATYTRLQAGEKVTELASLGNLANNRVSVRLWPHEAPDCMLNMRLAAEGYGPGVILLLAISERETMLLRFAVDFANGRIHTMLEDSCVTEKFNEVTEVEVEHFTRFFHSVIANGIVELCIDGVDPVQCEVVVPENIIPQIPEEMVAKALHHFRERRERARVPDAIAPAAPGTATPDQVPTNPAESQGGEQQRDP